jgi:hypothetical protein
MNFEMTVTEIPNFQNRWVQANPSTKGLLLNLIEIVGRFRSSEGDEVILHSSVDLIGLLYYRALSLGPTK